MDEAPKMTHLTWVNIGIGLVFLILDAVLSVVLKLGLEASILIAAIRCVVQLSVMALLLKSVFSTNNPWAVAGLSCLLILLGTVETVFNKSKRRFSHMFPSVLVSMASSVVPVSILGTRFAMGYDPFWQPTAYIPVLGMLCGSTISAIVVSTSGVLRDLKDNRDKVEMYLAFGGSRFEACKPIATDALRLALTPTLNQMSVIGLISIPGMMTGVVLAGGSVEQAARLQMIIMFLISASTALAAIIATVLALSIVVDAEHRIQEHRIREVRFERSRGGGWLTAARLKTAVWRPWRS